MASKFIEYYILLLFEILFLGLAFQAVLIQDTTRFFAVLTAMGIALIPVVVEWGLSIRLTPGVKSVVALALLVHMAGGINRWYWKFAPYYDKLAHVIAALALGMAVLSLFLILNTRGVPVRPPLIIAWIIIVVILFGALWEIGEYSIDLLVRSSYNNGVMDSIYDTISNLIGLVIAVAYSWWIMKRIPIGETPGYLINIT
jgi:VanZ family protein